MQIPEKDVSSLLDMCEYCKHVMNIVNKTKFYYFEKNKERQMAVERGIMIIGEASNRLSEETKHTLSNIPWAEIKGMRNKIVHDYGDIKIERIWKTAKIYVPNLLNQLLAIEEVKKYL